MDDLYGSGGLFGMSRSQLMGQDDEEERKRMAALAAGNTPAGNAFEGLAGGGAALGTMSGSPFSFSPPSSLGASNPAGGLFGMSQREMVPDAAQLAQLKMPPMAPRSEDLGPTAGSPVPASGMFPSLGPSAEPKADYYNMAGPAQYGKWYSGWGREVPAPGVAAADPIDRVRQLYSENLGNGPGMGWDQANGLLRAQLGAFGQSQLGQNRLDEQRIQSEGRIREAELRHKMENSPEALRNMTHKALLGANLSKFIDNPGRALQETQDAMRQFDARQSGAATPTTSSFSEHEFGRNLLDVMGPNFKVDAIGKNMPAQQGTAKEFGSPQAGQLVERIKQLPEDQRKAALEYVMKTPGVADVLTGRFAAQEMAQNYNVADAPKGTGSGIGGFVRDAFNRADRNSPIDIPSWMRTAADTVLPTTPDAYPSPTLEGMPGFQYLTSSPEEGKTTRAIQNTLSASVRDRNPYRFVTRDGKYIPLDRESLTGNSAKEKAIADESLRKAFAELMGPRR